jgi:hypothetical protein
MPRPVQRTTGYAAAPTFSLFCVTASKKGLQVWSGSFRRIFAEKGGQVGEIFCFDRVT